MKAILFCAACLFCSTVLEAQFTEKGQRVIGSSFTFYSASSKNIQLPNEENKGTNFSINANAGKFRKKNVLSRYGLSYSYSTSKNISSINTVSNRVHAVFADYGKTWFKNIGRNFYFGLGGSVGAGYSSSIIKNTNFTQAFDSKTYQANLNIYPVLAWQATKRFVLNCSPANNFLNLGVNYSKIKQTDGSVLLSSAESRSISLNTGFFGSPLANLSIGFSYLLGQKKS